jgi:hypothetical protein
MICGHINHDNHAYPVELAKGAARSRRSAAAAEYRRRPARGGPTVSARP